LSIKPVTIAATIKISDEPARYADFSEHKPQYIDPMLYELVLQAPQFKHSLVQIDELSCGCIDNPVFATNIPIVNGQKPPAIPDENSCFKFTAPYSERIRFIPGSRKAKTYSIDEAQEQLCKIMRSRGFTVSSNPGQPLHGARRPETLWIMLHLVVRQHVAK